MMDDPQNSRRLLLDELRREFGAVSDDDPLLAFMRVADRVFHHYTRRMEDLARQAEQDAEARRRHDRYTSWLFALLALLQLAQGLLLLKQFLGN